MGNFFFVRLAAGNLIRNRRFYFPYLLTGILTAAMFYNMTFLAWSQDISTMPGGPVVASILTMGVSVIGLFAVIFLFYTNSFLMKRRQKELGLYNILGMSKRHIARVLLWETIYTCFLTIAGGLAVGILLSKLLMLLLFRLLFFTVHFGFSVGVPSIVATAMLFGGIYFLTLLYHFLHLRLSNPVELLKGGNVGEKEPKSSKIITLLGILTLAAGYGIALTVKSPLKALMLFFLAVILVIAGTYCLFTSGSIALLKGMKKKKSYYYQPKHFISVSGMLYRMKQNAVGLANICVLSTMVLVMLSTCFCMYFGVNDALDSLYPHDLLFTQDLSSSDILPTSEYRSIVLEQVERSGLTPTKTQEWDVLRAFTLPNAAGSFTPVSDDDNILDIADTVYTQVITADSYSNVTGETLELAPDEVAVCSTESLDDTDTITIFDLPFTVSRHLSADSDQGASAFLSEPNVYTDRQLLLVVSDLDVLIQLCQQQASLGQTNNVNWMFSLDFDGAKDEDVEALYESVRTALEEAQTQQNPDQTPNLSISCRQEGRTSVYVLYGGLLFLGLFLGTIFLIATVLIIYYKQISEGYDDKERFAILEKVGMSQEQIRASIRSQVRAVFFLPLLGAVIHLAFSFRIITKLMKAMYLTNIPLFALTCLGTTAVFAAGYLVIYLLTARTYYRIVR